MGDVVKFNGITRLNLPVDTILDEARGRLGGIVILGYDTAGEEYFATSYADYSEALWLLERCKKALLE